MQYTKVSVNVSPANEIANDLLMAQMGELGFESFCESETGFDAFIPSADYDATTLKQLNLPFEGTSLSFQTETIADQNWNKVWEENYFQPIAIGKDCLVRSTFHKPIEDVKYEILIDPKMAFGTGHHSTTSLMLQHILETDVKNKTVLDMGCGTAILGMLCSMKGSKSILGIDIDEWAYNNALENIGLNNISNMQIQLGGSELLNETKFDIILANINRNILLDNLQHYSKVLNSDGTLFLSGFYTEDLPVINAETEKQGLKYISHKTDNNWVAATYKLSE
ncbi:50S ribosomal protein L11 methyltransferase [Carboxylicivirga sp. N1Y90]|uniref:50S ribosomal protein L11 methyltransferase n=1 Tax=Carboxylicivirga fragile TaxID=3417571 RepID=UPI003D34EE77|nr:50S ribosomal protein L11 methyltransferase [Marinilabiliaceae bacterium N1Y90]